MTALGFWTTPGELTPEDVAACRARLELAGRQGVREIREGDRVWTFRELEQEPVSNFRRDLAAEDDFRIRVEAIARDLLHRERVALAWLARRIRRETR